MFISIYLQPVQWIAMEYVVKRHVHCVKTLVFVTPKMVPVFAHRDLSVLCVTNVSLSIPVVNYTVVFLWLLYLIPLHTVYYQYLCLQLLHEHAPKLRFMFHEIM